LTYEQIAQDYPIKRIVAAEEMATGGYLAG
jgi:hypothetical protein